MDLAEVFAALKATSLAEFIGLSAWAFPVIESVHVIAIALVFGVIAIVDLRLLGVASVSRRVSEVALDSLPIVWGAFVLAVVSGSLMFVSNPQVYFDNGWFRWKLLFILLAGVNMAIFSLFTARRMPDWDDGSVSVPPRGKIAGLASLGFWIAVIVCGRMIGFTLYDLPF